MTGIENVHHLQNKSSALSCSMLWMSGTFVKSFHSFLLKSYLSFVFGLLGSTMHMWEVMKCCGSDYFYFAGHFIFYLYFLVYILHLFFVLLGILFLVYFIFTFFLFLFATLFYFFKSYLICYLLFWQIKSGISAKTASLNTSVQNETN